MQNLQNSRGAGGIMLIVGLAGALWSASGYVAAFMRASNAPYDVDEGRSIWKKLPVRLGVTVVLLVLDPFFEPPTPRRYGAESTLGRAP